MARAAAAVVAFEVARQVRVVMAVAVMGVAGTVAEVLEAGEGEAEQKVGESKEAELVAGAERAVVVMELTSLTLSSGFASK